MAKCRIECLAWSQLDCPTSGTDTAIVQGTNALKPGAEIVLSMNAKGTN